MASIPTGACLCVRIMSTTGTCLPGNYTFKVRARLPNEKWSDVNMASMGIKVNPPLWNTWWARIIYLMLFIVGIWIWVKYYKRKVNRRSALEIETKKGR